MNSLAETDHLITLGAISGDKPGLVLPSFWTGGLAASAAWALAAALTWVWPDLTPWARTGLLALLEVGVAAVLAAVALFGGARFAVLHPYDRWFGALAAILSLWQVLTAKTGLLPLPFFPPPQSIVEVYTDDAARLFESVWRSLLLLIPGYVIGGGLGFVTGAAIGWSKAANYWGHPILRFVGPLPATAWLPIAFFFFPSSQSASTFLVGLATFFPVAVLTASGVKGVNAAYYDIARTLGGSERFLILKVAVPAALPNVFVGLFMGLGSSFAVLIIAEMMGVKAGLGWYLQWAQGWAAYANLYGALIVMALLFSGLISLLFFVRDRVLAWQKGIVRW